MAGRKKVPGAEVRSEQMSVRWTPEEMQMLRAFQKSRGITYLADVPRLLALQQIRLDGLIGARREVLDRLQEELNFGSQEELLWFLAGKQLDQVLSMLEIDVAK